MDLTSIELRPYGSSDVLLFSFRDPKAINPFNIKNITGLNPDAFVPKYYGSEEAQKLFALSLVKRTVVLQAGLNPDFSSDESYSDLRDAVYRTIAASRTGEVQLRFIWNTTVVAVISGFVTKVESDLFAKSQEVQITVDCPDPLLKSLTPVAFSIDNVDPSVIVLEDERSTAPHGFSFVMHFNNNVSVLTITNDALGFSFTVRPKDHFAAGDKLYFSSEFNSKHIYQKRGTTIIHLADVIDFNSIWPVIFPGINTLQANVTAPTLWESVTHHETYWGV